MIEDEVRLALEALPPERRPPLVWMESGLHDRPERLQAALAGPHPTCSTKAPRRGTAVDRTVGHARHGARRPSAARRSSVGPVAEVLLALGLLRQRPQGLGRRNLTLVFPRVDDCISLLLNDGCVREEIPRNPRCYYLTRGWFSHESSLTQAFDEWDGALRSRAGGKLRQAMFAGYEQSQPHRHAGLRGRGMHRAEPGRSRRT